MSYSTDGGFMSIGSAAASNDSMRSIFIKTTGNTSTNDSLSIGRIYVSDAAPVPESSSYALIARALALTCVATRRQSK